MGCPSRRLGRRYDLLEDQLAVLHGVWSAPASGLLLEHDGFTGRVEMQADSFRPVQRPHPPIVRPGGGAAPATAGWRPRPRTSF